MSAREGEESHDEVSTEEERRFEEALRQLAADTPVSPFCAGVGRHAAVLPDVSGRGARCGAWRGVAASALPVPSRLSLAVSVLAAGLVLSLAANVWLTFPSQAPGIQQGTLGQDVQRQWLCQRQAFTLLTAPEARPVPLRSNQADSRARGFLLLKPDDLHAVLIVQNLPSLPQDRAYQIWLGWGDRQRDNGGVFRVDEQGWSWCPSPHRPFTTYQRVGILKNLPAAVQVRPRRV